MTIDNSKRIAKNTVFLYFRMIFSMIISLYTSRIILDSLGINDFGIYNVVSGIIGLFTFLNTSMTSATQRFLNFNLGELNNERLNTVFNTSLIIHAFISLAVLLLSESIGLWVLNNKMTIPPEKLFAANWIFQFSILSGIIYIATVPYHALIIANEKMKAFAYLSIIEVIAKLLAAYVVYTFDSNKLIYYSISLFFLTTSSRLIYIYYCNREFPESKLKLIWDKKLFLDMSSFASWSIVGNLSYSSVSQGLNILLNVFYGPILNAARGIAVQVQNALNSFAVNFQTAIDPQIIKSYAKKDFSYLQKLIFNGSKYSFYLILIFALPLLLETNFVLELWLKEIPAHTSSIVRILLIISLADAVANPINTAIRATGNIRKYEIVMGSILILTVPMAYICLKFGFYPESIFVVHLVIVIISQYVRLNISRRMLDYRIKDFMTKVIKPIFIVSIISVVVPLYIKQIISSGFGRFILVSVGSFVSVIISVYCFGIEKYEREIINEKFTQLFRAYYRMLKIETRYKNIR